MEQRVQVLHCEGGSVLAGESLWWQRLQLHKISFTTRLVNSAMDLLLTPSSRLLTTRNKKNIPHHHLQEVRCRNIC